ncbi:TatD family hydrolase [Desulforhopalus sp. IMCC35007]|uniref:TatD family hydrolase n=1 Tax=Desulforhopalus sp. IMCC35007 TaxID=2569543 RepID=UPI0010ADD291|nr:TatD family hydrolase [Desulforhopalus sp. IMCC35007]TKB11602.1 TatD family deoxyribonuclease [Desulforhopalus sp. IMCC35007]
MQLIDSHCHLDFWQEKAQIDKVIDEAGEVGVEGFIIPGVVASGWNEQIEICRQNHKVHCAAGMHPLYLSQHRPGDLKRLEELCNKDLLVAIGEIGLDFYHSTEHQKKQQELFEEQLAVASKNNLPVILHVRKAHDQILATLRRTHFKPGGTVHAFTGSLQQAEQYIGLGFVLGIGGAITHERAKKLRSTVTKLPETSLILETDAPDMVLAGRKGEVNQPKYLPEILAELASLRMQDPEQLGKTTRQTTIDIFHLN